MPTREQSRPYSRQFHDWYFGEDAGGMFLSPAAKELYIRLLSKIAEVAYRVKPVGEAAEQPYTDAESQQLRSRASELWHQLAEDVGTVNPPRVR